MLFVCVLNRVQQWATAFGKQIQALSNRYSGAQLLPLLLFSTAIIFFTPNYTEICLYLLISILISKQSGTFLIFSDDLQRKQVLSVISNESNCCVMCSCVQLSGICLNSHYTLIKTILYC